MLKKFNIILMLSIIVGISSLTHGIESKSVSGGLLGGWLTYDQQLGGLNNRFFTLGGVSAGISVLGLSIGLGVHGSYPYSSSDVIDDEFQYYYGGLVLGYKSPWKLVGVRAFVTLGAASTDSKFDNFRMYFVIAPSLHIDIHVYKSLVLSLGMTYRYHYSKQEIYSYNINDWKNSLSATLSFGWVY